jgi:hypothetical protein
MFARSIEAILFCWAKFVGWAMALQPPNSTVGAAAEPLLA